MSTTRVVALALALGVLSASTSHGDILALYTGSLDPESYAAESLTASGVTLDGLAGYGGVGYLQAHANGISSAALALAQSPPSQYSFLEFTITPNSGYSLSLSSLSFDGSVYENLGSPFIVVSSSIGGLDQGLASFGFISTSPSSCSVDLSGMAFRNITAPVTFRVLGYGPGALFADVSSLDNVTLNGTAVAVPEPSTFALLYLGAFGLVIRQRRRLSMAG